MEMGCKTDYHIGKRRTTKESSEAFNLMVLWLFCRFFVVSRKNYLYSNLEYRRI